MLRILKQNRVWNLEKRFLDARLGLWFDSRAFQAALTNGQFRATGLAGIRREISVTMSETSGGVAMARRERIVRAYLERVSWRVLDKWREILAVQIKGQAGIYALYKGDKLYYVGLARSLMGRVNHHLKDRHKGKWERFSVYLTVNDEHVRSLEALLLRIVDLSGNRVKGRLGNAQDLARQLRREAHERARDEAAVLLGGRYIRHRRRQRIKTAEGVEGLRGLVERRLPLRAKYKGKLFRAALRRDGRISLKGQVYDSPSNAATAAIGRGANGWHFWRFRDEKRQWVKLLKLKG